ncbi:MAG TPA: hypothetical protein VNR88_08320 [Hyphomicrobium sp.]|nr:hypothetical protein [Hyphomicrobium sp.]
MRITLSPKMSVACIKLSVIAAACFLEVFQCSRMHPWLVADAGEGAVGNRIVVLRVLPVVKNERIDLILIEIFED